METATLTPWKPSMDLPYVVSFKEGGMLAINLKAAWLKPDQSGQPLLLPPAVRALERKRLEIAAQAGGYHGVSDYVRDAALAAR